MKDGWLELVEAFQNRDIVGRESITNRKEYFGGHLVSN